MSKNINSGTIIRGRYTKTGAIFIGEVIALPREKKGKVLFKYLENFGWSKNNKRGCLGRVWLANVWEVNSKEPSLRSMKFRKQKKRPKTKIITTTTTIIKKKRVVKIYN